MRRSQAARYARWSATIAAVLAGATLVVYIQRRWSAHLVAKSAPPPAASNIKQELSHGLTFSKQEGNRTIFTVEASKSTDFRDKDSTLLERVNITIFGKEGDRHDILRTQSCQFSRADGAVECSGEVTMEVQSASDFARLAANPNSGAPQIVHVETRGVTFDKSSGIARTEQLVHFAFPNGEGQGIGLRYNSDQGALVLVKDVQFHLRQTPEQKQSPSAHVPVHGDVSVTGSSLEFHRDSHQMLLHGPAQAWTETARLTAGEMRVDLDAQFRANRIQADPAGDEKRPVLSMIGGSGRSELSAKGIAVSLTSAGWIDNVEAKGDVRGTRSDPGGDSDMVAQEARLDFYEGGTKPRELNLHGAVVLNTKASSGESRHLESDKARLRFNEQNEGDGTKLKLAETLAPGTLEWVDALTKSGPPAQTKVQGDTLAMQFDAEGKPSLLSANGHVHTERTSAGNPSQIAEGKIGTVQMARTGVWMQMELDGQVQLKEGDRSATADHALFRRAEQTALLTGNALVRDATTQTTAPSIAFHQGTGEILAEGGVQSVDFAARGGSPNLRVVPVNISSGKMQADSRTGCATYSVRARLWQGASVLEADTIELRRNERILIGTNNVRAVFPQEQTRGSAGNATNGGKTPILWHVRAQELTYYDAENRAHLEHNVLAKSNAEEIRSELMDLYFTRSSDGSLANSTVAPGAQQISRADAAGNVVVQQGTRKAQAEHGEYIASEGKFVMSGGNPTIFDGSAGTTTGRKLTFFLADDTIIVDSADGTRTVTKHRVER